MLDLDGSPTRRSTRRPICHVRQRVSRFNERIGFYADEAGSIALMHLNARSRFDSWSRYELTDSALRPIGAIEKVFVARRRRSQYVVYGGEGEKVGRIQPQVPDVLRRRATRIAVVVAAGAVGIPIIGAAGVAAAASLVVAAAVRQVRGAIDPVDVVRQLRVDHGEHALGIIRRRVPADPSGAAGVPIPVPWRSPTSVYEIDMSADSSNTVDRRLILAVPVALAALRGVVAESPLR